MLDDLVLESRATNTIPIDHNLRRQLTLVVGLVVLESVMSEVFKNHSTLESYSLFNEILAFGLSNELLMQLLRIGFREMLGHSSCISSG